MANPQHIQWLLEGVGGWNARRDSNEFSPDLSDADLSDADLSNANLTNANLSDANLSDADLSNADLTNANLSDANLSDADLSNANLANANFSDANLSDASLFQAKLLDANLSKANLSRVELFGADLSRANLSNAYLADAELDTADLTGATLNHSNLTNASLFVADLTSANLTGAELFKANLENAILRNADLTNTKLSETNLRNADLSGANLTLTDLSRADLTGVEPWLARLYEDDRSSALYQYQIRRKQINSIESLLAIARDLKARYGKSHYDKQVVLYFRGETREGWELRPAVLRDELAKHESEMLHELIKRRPMEFTGLPSALSKWVLAQHHGLRTRFLDITKNPLVGLFYACENHNENNSSNGRLHVFAVPKTLVKSFNSDTVSVISNFGRLSKEQQDLILGNEQLENQTTCRQRKDLFAISKYRATMQRFCQLIQEEKPNFEERIDIGDLYRALIVEPQQSSERVRAQAGAFLVSAFHERFERDQILRYNSLTPVYAHYVFSIPNREKEKIRNELESVGITRETLFPGLDETAKVVTELMRRSR